MNNSETYKEVVQDFKKALEESIMASESIANRKLGLKNYWLSGFNGTLFKYCCGN